MIRLSREIRFALASPTELADQLNHSDQKNSWSAWPNCSRIVPQLRLTAVVEGQPDPETGYLCNVNLIDGALRRFVNESLIPSIAELPLSKLPSGQAILLQAFKFLSQQQFDNAALSAATIHLSPFQSFGIETGASAMIQFTHQFEFSAAHRLHCDSMSPEENAAVFGKCNNPAGHGHNYVVEVTVAQELEAHRKNDSISPDRLSAIVNRNVIDVLDHKNLNEDIDVFSTLNPSVENICHTIFGWLVSDVEETGCQLAEVKVFETPKTWASFRR